MDKESSASNRQWMPAIVVVVVVLVGTIANLILLAQYAGLKTVPEGFQKVWGDVGFVKWGSEYGMDDLAPNMVFAVVNGRMVGDFEFQSDAYGTLISAGVRDNVQRPWINVDHSDGTHHVNLYPEGDNHIETEPTVIFLDTDGDGLTDRKVDWLNHKTYDAAGPLTWSPFKPAAKSSEPWAPRSNRCSGSPS